MVSMHFQIHADVVAATTQSVVAGDGVDIASSSYKTKQEFDVAAQHFGPSLIEQIARARRRIGAE